MTTVFCGGLASSACVPTVSWSKEPSCPHMGYKRESWQEKMRLLLGQGLLDWFCFWFPLPLGGSELTEGRKEGRFALIPNWLTNYDQQPVQQTVASPRMELSHNQIFVYGKVDETACNCSPPCLGPHPFGSVVLARPWTCTQLLMSCTNPSSERKLTLWSILLFWRGLSLWLL